MSEPAAQVPTPTDTDSQYSLGQLVAYFLRLGTLGFGGPVALVGYMHRDLVERRGWMTESDYKEGLTLAQLMPGPLAAQLSIYLGYVHHGVIGATLAGVAFVLPSFFMVLALGWAYRLYGGLSWMQAVFYGVGSSVIAIITISALKLTKKTVGRDWLLGVIFAISTATTVVTESEAVLFFLAAGLIVWLTRTPPSVLKRRTVSMALMPLGLFGVGASRRSRSCSRESSYSSPRRVRLSLEAAWRSSHFCTAV